MNIVLCTLALNEMEWLPLLYDQHRHWPGMVKWIFVEAADRIYAETNPDMVSSKGLSVDGTTEWISTLCEWDTRVHYIDHGFCSHPDRAQGKCEARNRYLQVCEEMTPKPDYIIIVDSDEFYTYRDQRSINKLLGSSSNYHLGTVLKQRHIWYHPPIHPRVTPLEVYYKSLFHREVVGGYWSIPHCRIWKYIPGMRYRNNHNTPDHPNGGSFKEMMIRYDRMLDIEGSPYPKCIHMGYASSQLSRAAKHKYYIARGEGKEQGRLGKQRSMYVDCRSAYESWQEGDTLPHGARVVEYTGPIPECFQSVEVDPEEFQQYIPPGYYIVEDADGERLVRKDDPNRG